MIRMQTRKSRKAGTAARKASFSSLASILAVLGLVVLMATPALAHHKKHHMQGKNTAGNHQQADAQASDNDGDADSDSSTRYTEDNDTNDGGTKNNVSDDGDNAHPSGKDRSVERGGSGAQGKAESDPDDDGRGPERSNGGPDKANGSGGVDKADQDGNNGCGNDDDFEDDNEGLCLGRERAPKPPKVDGRPDEVDAVEVCPAGTVNAGQPMDSLADCFDDDVDSRTDGVCPAGTAKAGEPMDSLADCDEVLGVVIRKGTPQVTNVAPQVRSAGPVAVKGAVLPFTGASLIAFVIAAFGLIAAGFVALKVRANS